MKKFALFLVSIFILSLLAAAPASAQTTSPYITPGPTGANFDFMILPGGIVWFGGMLFYAVGKYVTAKFAALSQAAST